MQNETKTALITGASSGIGLELAKIHAENHHNLILIARSGQKLEAIKAELEKQHPIEVKVWPMDLGEQDAAKIIADRLNAENIVVEFLINNAGFGDFGFFKDTSWEKEEQMIQLNITALTQLTKYILPEMVKRKSGKIMNLASTASFQPGPLMAVYYATKHYVLAFSEAIANECKGTGVTVTALCPGPTASGFQDAADLHDSKLVKGKKLPTAKEVANYGYKAMMKGKTVAIHGFMNRIMAASVRFSPRDMVTQLVRKMSEAQ